MTQKIFLEEETNYIIVRRVKGEINDVWKLIGARIEYNSTANGWRVITKQGAVFFVSGEVEIWHIPDENVDGEVWDIYKQYHNHMVNGISYLDYFVEPTKPTVVYKTLKLFKFFGWDILAKTIDKVKTRALRQQI